MSHPYSDMPPRAFWRSAIAEADRDVLPDLYHPRIAIDQDTRVVTAGSCFAQHIGNYLTLAGCNVLDAEPAPRDMSDDIARHFGYGIYSARYGNVYTARQLRQLLEDVVADATSWHLRRAKASVPQLHPCRSPCRPARDPRFAATLQLRHEAVADSLSGSANSDGNA